MNGDGVRDAGGWTDDGRYGLLVGRADRVLEVLKDPGGRFSACGYADRMAKSIGVGFLGQDDEGPHAGHRDHAPQVNRAVEGYLDEKTLCAQAAAVAGALLQQSTAGGPARVDIIQLAGGGAGAAERGLVRAARRPLHGRRRRSERRGGSAVPARQLPGGVALHLQHAASGPPGRDARARATARASPAPSPTGSPIPAAIRARRPAGAAR